MRGGGGRSSPPRAEAPSRAGNQLMAGLGRSGSTQPVAAMTAIGARTAPPSRGRPARSGAERMGTKANAIQIGILGLGNIGAGTVEILRRNGALIERRLGVPFELARAADLDQARAA